MPEEAEPRKSRFGAIVVAVTIAGSLVGVLGWYFLTNRGSSLDNSGFDLSVAPQAPRALPVASATPAPAAPQSSLGMLKADAGITVVAPASSAGGPPRPAGAAEAPAAKKDDPHQSFTQAARAHEMDVQRFAARMSAKHPIIRQYGRDWMSYPDLKKLNDDYNRNHDPVAFMVGLAHAPNLGPMLKKYGGRPEMREFIVQGMKEAPGDLTSAALDVLRNDKLAKDLVANAVSGLGLPPTITAMFGGGSAPDPSKMNQAQMQKDVTKDVMNNPEVQKALQSSGQQAPPVVLPR